MVSLWFCKVDLTNNTIYSSKKPEKTQYIVFFQAMAGETRFEHATYGFGDRYSTVEPLP